MKPALLPGQLALLHGNYYSTRALQRGDVIAFRWKGQVYVKRIHALGGEPVRLICNDGYCIPISDDAVPRARRVVQRFSWYRLRSLVVPPRHIFALGDHWTVSVDSRELGPIPESAILGRVRSVWGAPLRRAGAARPRGAHSPRRLLPGAAIYPKRPRT